MAARGIGEAILAHFYDGEGGFFDTSDDHEKLIARPKGLQDGAQPSGGSVATQLLLRLAAYTGEARYREAAEAALARVEALMSEIPLGFANWLNALDFALAPPVEVAILGEDPAALLEVVFGGFRPNVVVACGIGEGVPSPIPMLEGKETRDGRPAAYVCRQFTCMEPVSDPSDLKRVLDESG